MSMNGCYPWPLVTAERSQRHRQAAVRSDPVSAALFLPLRHDLRQEGIGAGGVVGRIGKRQDRLVVADGEAFDGAEGGVG